MSCLNSLCQLRLVGGFFRGADSVAADEQCQTGQQHGSGAGCDPDGRADADVAHGGELGITDSCLDLLSIDLVFVLRESREQCFVGQYVDTSCQSFRTGADQLDGARREEIGAVIAGCPDTKHQVGADVISPERFQREVVSDPFLELAHARVGQSFVEFRLTKQDNMQEFVPVRLEVG